MEMIRIDISLAPFVLIKTSNT